MHSVNFYHVTCYLVPSLLSLTLRSQDNSRNHKVERGLGKHAEAGNIKIWSMDQGRHKLGRKQDAEMMGRRDKIKLAKLSKQICYR